MENTESSGEKGRNDGEKPPKTIRAEDLFGGATEVLIEHDGQVYRLRITSRNKLILQK